VGLRIAAAAPVAETMAAAAAAYDDGRVAEARALYEQLHQPDRVYPVLLYNLGNCAYREGKYGEALSYYERARRLAPRDSDIVENLNFVRSQLRLPSVRNGDSPLAALRAWRDWLRPDEWLAIAGLAWLGFWSVLAISRWRRQGLHLAAALPLLVAGVLAVAAWAAQLQSTYQPGQAVVTAPITELYALPHKTERKAGPPLKAGDYVTVIEQRSEWSRVRIDEAEGWIRNSACQHFWD
jgi:tetratricopeptide (TPR) repeat protein